MCEKVTGISQTANGLTAESLTVRSSLPEVNTSGAETPDLSRFYKSRSRDSSLIETAKKMLVHGYTPGKTALLLRLPYDLVKGLYDNSWNPRCRKISNPTTGAAYVAADADNCAVALQNQVAGDARSLVISDTQCVFNPSGLVVAAAAKDAAYAALVKQGNRIADANTAI